MNKDGKGGFQDVPREYPRKDSLRVKFPQLSLGKVEASSRLSPTGPDSFTGEATKEKARSLRDVMTIDSQMVLLVVPV